MKKKLAIWGSLFIVLQMIKSLLLWDYASSFGTERIEILVNAEGLLNDKSAASVKVEADYQIAKSSYKENLIAENQLVDVAAVNVYWHQVQRMQMLEGAFWGGVADEEGRNLAVISDTLAVKLWGSEKAFGGTLHIQDQVYQVVGVYKRYQKMRQYYLDDGKEKIYIPLKSSLSAKWPIKFMVIDGTNQETLPEEKDLLAIGIDTSDDTVSHREKWFKSQQSLAWLPIMMGGLLILPFSIGSVKKVLANHEKTLKTKLLILSGTFIMMLVLLKVCIARIYINPSQLPSENIFDLAFYWEEILSQWHVHNQLIRYPFSQFEKAYHLLKHWTYFINFLQIIIEIKIMYIYKQLIR